MKRFLQYIEEEQWERMKPSDLPPVDKAAVDKRSKERDEYRAANAKARSKIPTGKEYTDMLPMRDPRTTRPGSEKFKAQNQINTLSAERGSRVLDPYRDLDDLAHELNPDRYDPPENQKKKGSSDEYQTGAKGKPHITLDTKMDQQIIIPPESAKVHFNPSLKARNKT